MININLKDVAEEWCRNNAITHSERQTVMAFVEHIRAIFQTELGD